MRRKVNCSIEKKCFEYLDFTEKTFYTLFRFQFWPFLSGVFMNFTELRARYLIKVYHVFIKFPPFRLGSDQTIGYYESEDLAERVWDVFHKHFMIRINGGVDVSYKPVFVSAGKIAEDWHWHLIDDPDRIIENSFDKEKIQACINSLTEYAKRIKIKIVDGNGKERVEGVFINPKRKTGQDQDAEPKKQKCPKEKEDYKEAKVDPEEELVKLGFSPFNGRKELRNAYTKWVLVNHPDKKPEGPERDAADIQFRRMKKNYDAVLEEMVRREG